MHQAGRVRIPCGGGFRRNGIVRWAVSAESTREMETLKAHPQPIPIKIYWSVKNYEIQRPQNA